MTASKENLGGVGKASKVISSTLAGVLAVGMIPAAGFAAEAADEGTSDADIDLLAVTENAAFSQGAVTAAVDQSGKAISDLANISFTVSGSAQYVKPSTVLPANATEAVQILDEDGNIVTNSSNDALYEFTYMSADDWKANKSNIANATPLTPADIKAAGDYVVVVMPTAANTQYTGSATTGPAVEFSIVGKSLQGATIVDSETNSSTLTYDGQSQPLAVSLNGAKLTLTTDYTVVYYQDEAGKPSQTVASPTNAGDYIAVITGAGNYANSTVNVPFTINSLNLSTATIAGADIEKADSDNTSTNPSPTTINGIPWADLSSAVEVDYVAGHNGNKPFTQTQTGSYVFDVTPSNPDSANVIGAGTMTVSVVDTLGGISIDGGTTLASTFTKAAPKTINYAKGDQAFNFSSVKLYELNDKGEPTSTEIPDVTFNYTVTDADGNVVSQASIANPGLWNITAVVNTAANGYTAGGQSSFWIKVTNAEIDGATSIYANYKGEPTGSAVNATYSGSNVLDDIDVVVIGPDKTPLVMGTDYTLSIKDAAGETVDSIVDKGTYTITVESNDYTFTDGTNTITVTVAALDFKTVRISPSQMFNQDQFIPYTGNDITPVLEYTTAAKLNASTRWTAVPEGVYTLTYSYAATKAAAEAGTFKPVNAINQVGYYKIGFAINDDVENYTSTADDVVYEYLNAADGVTQYDTNDVIQVSDEKVFLDVPTNEWFASYIYAANQLNYMHGYNGSDFFGPYDKMKRGDVALVLYRMSLSNVAPEDGISPREATFNDDYFNDNAGYDTPFADVDSHMYYARAIAWAANTGIVTGYAGTDDFGPEDSVTREQFATMLGRFAQKAGNFEVEDADAALAAYADGAQVDAWAKDYVAWAVENKIMGNNPTLNPLDDIIRAEIAKMVVVYQPEDNTFIQ